jgi:hypothetical protein
MFATVEEKLIVAALSTIIVLVGILGFIHHERREGATVCVQQQTNAATAETKKDTADVQSTLKDFSGDLSAIPVTASRTPMLMCDAPSSVRKVSATGHAQPTALPIVKTDSGLQTGVEPRVDIGPIVQDLALSGMLCTADAQQLWNLAVKESAP